MTPYWTQDAGHAPGKSCNWPLEAGEEVQGRGQGWQALGIGLDEQLVPCPLDPQRLAPFTLEPVTEAVLGLVIDNAIFPGLDQQQWRLDPVCLRDGASPALMPSRIQWAVTPPSLICGCCS